MIYTRFVTKKLKPSRLGRILRGILKNAINEHRIRNDENIKSLTKTVAENIKRSL